MTATEKQALRTLSPCTLIVTEMIDVLVHFLVAHAVGYWGIFVQSTKGRGIRVV